MGKSPLGNIPNEMIQLFTANDDATKNFLGNIRQYNNAFSFVTFEAKVTPPTGYRPYYFKIHGMLHHKVSSLYPENKKDSAYGQLYILDCDAVNNIRLTRVVNSGLKKEILTKLNKILEKDNPYVPTSNFIKSCTIKSLKILPWLQKKNREPKYFVMRFYHQPNSDMRRYNNPTYDEVAVIFETIDGVLPSHRCISVYVQKTLNLLTQSYS